ncbi:transcription factor pcc1 [Ophiostoma piceae UAMH 11346]|uniref:Transcription factor pcc1 n=1 Tax=Ophiostoma piceae (strain UAMH 11346) TaxID=1262450 RepID=S3C455_OPHP1|nr:transcription factor pcc1 [Ophiostoma piceae UAMH 11346]
MAAVMEFPCSLVLDIPFPTARLATVALQALSVDKEISPSVRKSFAVRAAEDAGADTDKTVLRTTYEATTNRMLRVSVNAFLDSVGLVVEVMEGLDVDVLAEAT